MNPGEIDIHARQRRRQRIEEILKEDKQICQINKNLILDYAEYRTIESSISLLRQEKIISNLMTYARFLGKPFTEATKKDIQDITKKVYTMPSDKNHGQAIADSTKNMYCKILKKFFSWLKKEDTPEETAWLKPPRAGIKKLTKKDRLYWRDVRELSRAATNERDFLLPQLLFDSGGRIEEVATLRRQDIDFFKLNGKEDGKPKLAARINIRVSKTETRSPDVYKCVPALRDWLDKMPVKTPDTPLFINLTKNHNAMSYKQLRTRLLKLRERSGIDKKVNPHSFRKSAASYCADKGMSDTQMDVRFGWKIGSRVKRHYIFPDETAANEAYLSMEGAVKVKKRDGEDLRPVVCWNCETLNPLGKDFCVNPECRMPLSPNKDIMKDKNTVRAVVMELLEETRSIDNIEKVKIE